MKRTNMISMGLVYLIVCAICICAASFVSFAVTASVQSAAVARRHCIVIDAGHGGIDGGATSVTGVLESHLNLQIALRLDDLLHLLGYDTRMIRTTDISVYTSGDTIAAQKVSDLKERLRICNETENAVVISIHQNTYPDSRYCGTQVFYASTGASEDLAAHLQNACTNALQQSANRRIKHAQNIYLLKNLQCTGVLIECGFLSNPQEEEKLRSVYYQKQLCCAIAAGLDEFLQSSS